MMSKDREIEELRSCLDDKTAECATMMADIQATRAQLNDDESKLLKRMKEDVLVKGTDKMD